MMKHHRQSLQLVFFLPMLFILALIGGLLAAVLEPVLRSWYLLFLLVAGLYHAWIAVRTRSWSLAVPVAGVTLLSLLVYGYGTIRGLASREAPTRKTLNPAKSVVAG